MKAYLLICITLSLASCTSDKKDRPLPGTVAARNFPKDTAAILDTAVKTSIPIENFTGLYISGDETSTFRDCSNPKKVYWVEDESKQLSMSYQKAKGYLSYPYESAAASVKGYLKGKSTEGYASEYENVLVVTEVREVKQKSFLTDCFGFEFVALGTEPFWGLEIIPSEKIIVLKDVSSEKFYIFPYQKPVIEGGKYSYDLINGSKETLKITINKEDCNDGMSDKNYSYAASIVINNKPLTGCAVKKGDKL